MIIIRPSPALATNAKAAETALDDPFLRIAGPSPGDVLATIGVAIAGDIIHRHVRSSCADGG